MVSGDCTEVSWEPTCRSLVTRRTYQGCGGLPNHHAFYLSKIFVSSGKRASIDLQQAHNFHEALLRWEKSLPRSVSLKWIVQPHQLLLHMHYVMVAISLFEPFIVVGNFERESAETTALATFAKESPESIVLKARNTMETLFRLYYIRHGFATWNPFMPQVTIF